MVLAGCAVTPANDGSIWTVPSFASSIPHAPELHGYKQLKSQGVEFRKYRVFHPDGLWTVRLDAEGDPIRVIMPSGKTFSFNSEWYPEEGGADSAAVYGFTKGDETLIILEGTSSMVYEETRIRFVGEEMRDLRRYAEKGAGMGEGAPGQVPEFREYPPR
ncbi:MAG: hypothetical protein RLZZ505_3265 [Verrucomicrobiota bacterium]|jgi:hypothetical protein